MRQIFHGFLLGAIFVSVFTGSSWAAATGVAVETVAHAVEVIKSNGSRADRTTRPLRPGEIRSYEFSESDVNAYILQWISQENSKKMDREVSVQSGALHFSDGQIVDAQAVARLGVGALKALGSGADSVLANKLKELLAIDNTMALSFRLSSAKGKIFVKVLSASVKGVPIPETLIQTILDTVGRKQRPPLDFNRFFPLPNGIQKVDVQKGRLKLVVRGM